MEVNFVLKGNLTWYFLVTYHLPFSISTAYLPLIEVEEQKGGDNIFVYLGTGYMYLGLRYID